MSDQETTEVVKGAFSKKIVSTENGVLEESSKNGLSWKIRILTELASSDSFNKIDQFVYFVLKFEWDDADLKKQGFDGFEGDIIVLFKKQNNQNVRLQFHVELCHPGEWFQRRIGTDEETKFLEPRCGYFRHFDVKFSLKKFSFEAKSAPSDFNDTVLIVEGRKIDVNKKYLSMHSEYFNKMFNSEFKEKSMPEIPINDVNYADFSRLLATIHPMRPVLPTDENIEYLLDLADRFMLPVVTERVINHLRYSAEIPFEEFLRIADKYKLHKLWKLILKPINSGIRMQLLVKNIEYEELSETAKLKLFSHFAKTLEQ